MQQENYAQILHQYRESVASERLHRHLTNRAVCKAKYEKLEKLIIARRHSKSTNTWTYVSTLL